MENLRVLLDSFIRPLAAQLKEEEDSATREGMAFSKYFFFAFWGKWNLIIIIIRFLELFSPLETLYRHHRLLLDRLAPLQSWSPEGSETQFLEPVLSDMKFYFCGYEKYIENYNEVLDIVKNSKMTDPAFASHYKTFAKVVPNGQNVPDYLILPIQHIPRYELILQRLFAKTEPNHLDFIPLYSAVRTTKTLAEGINDVMKKSVCGREIMDIQSRIQKCPSLLSPSRRYIMQGSLVRRPKLSRYYILFNDLLVETRLSRGTKPSRKLTKEEKAKRELIYSNSWTLDSLKIIELSKNDSSSESAFPGVRAHSVVSPESLLTIRLVITSPQKHGSDIMELVAKTERKCKSWTQGLKDAMKEASSLSSLDLRPPSPSSRTPDHESTPKSTANRFGALIKKKISLLPSGSFKDERESSLLTQETDDVSFDVARVAVVMVAYSDAGAFLGYVQMLRDHSFAVSSLERNDSSPLSCFVFRRYLKLKAAGKVSSNDLFRTFC